MKATITWRPCFLLAVVMVCSILLAGCSLMSGMPGDSGEVIVSDNVGQPSESATPDPEPSPSADGGLDFSDPATFEADRPWVYVNNNIPFFTEKDMTTEAFEEYRPLDVFSRCTGAYANICQELMPVEDGGEIEQGNPIGWHSVKYDNIDGEYLYNRCNLIGFQLSGENANERNTITGTKYLSVEGMLPFENMIANYVKETNNHVLYRVKPIYDKSNLIASGVLMEAYSVEDNGEGICFCVYAYNAQPGIYIDYETGESWEDASIGYPGQDVDSQDDDQYILNINSMEYHKPDCENAAEIGEQDRAEYSGSIDALAELGYEACGVCQSTQDDDNQDNNQYILNTNSREYHKPDCGSIAEISEQDHAEYSDPIDALDKLGYEACNACH